MSGNLARLREAITGRGREVEVAPDGSVHEVSPKPADTESALPTDNGTTKPAKQRRASRTERSERRR